PHRALRPGPTRRSSDLSCPAEERLSVTVKRVDGGYGSNWLCDNVTAGTSLEVLPPSGAFTPRSLDGDFLLIGAGSGITPLLSITDRKSTRLNSSHVKNT